VMMIERAWMTRMVSHGFAEDRCSREALPLSQLSL